MCFFFSLLPATFWLVIGYLLLYLSTRFEGPVRAFGRGLAIWVFIIAGGIVLAGAYVATVGMCPIDMCMEWNG